MEMTEVQYEASVLATGATFQYNTFPQFRSAMRDTISQNLAKYGAAVFLTSTKHLSSAYLAHFASEEEKHHHDCAACRDFIRKFGAAVVIDENNNVKSLMWDPETVPEDFKASVDAMKKMAEHGPIKGGMRFDMHGVDWGEEMAGGWNHLHYHFDHVALSELFQKDGVSIGNLAAAKTNHGYLKVNMARFKLETYRKAAALMASGRINRTDAFTDWINWILEVALKLEDVKDERIRDRILWTVVARLPHHAWATFASSMPGRMFEMIEQERVDSAIVKAFNEETAAENFQRSKSELTEGQANRAEQLIKQLGLETALQRRLATYDEVKKLAIWEKPAAVVKEADDKGIFGSLVGKKPGEKDDVETITSMTQTAPMTLRKFLATVLPNALEMHINISAPRAQLAQYFAPVHADAKPILRWDHEDNRYPYCWVQMVEGVALRDVGLIPGWIEVTSFLKAPWMNVDGPRAQGETYGLVLKGAKSFASSLDLFPEALLPQLHEVRAGMEAYRASQLVAAGVDTVVMAAPLGGQGLSVHLKVKTKLGWFLHVVDRLE